MSEKFHRPWQAAWDKRHLKTFGTKLTASQAQRLRDACDRAGVTPYKLIQNLLLSWLQEQQRQTDRTVPPDDGFYIRW